MASSLTVETTLVSAGADQLVFRYRARNTWNRDLFVFNKLARSESGTVKIDPNRVYIVADGNVLHVSKQLYEVPEHIDVLAPETPFVTRLAPGEEAQEEIRLALPAREAFPYAGGGPTPATEKRLCEQLVFTLGFFQAREAAWIHTAVLGGQEVLATEYGFASQTRGTASAAPLRARMECFVLSAPQWRPKS